MDVINSNSLTLAAQHHQGRADSELSSTLERLSSGLKINSASDDAAGLAIGNRMEENLNANDAVTKGITTASMWPSGPTHFRRLILDVLGMLYNLLDNDFQSL